MMSALRALWRAAASGDFVDLSDVITFGGIACACYGIAQVYEPAAWIAGGSALFWLGVRN